MENAIQFRITSRKGLRQVDFVFDGNEIRGLEQNPDSKSRWAEMARDGKKVMQFLSEGRYVANVVDGKVTLYGGRGATLRSLQGLTTTPRHVGTQIPRHQRTTLFVFF